jgi:4-hydroxythreonine-4-phosphate dehydrogenase
MSAGGRILGITIGDPAGIGPEIVDAALARWRPPPGISIEVVGRADGHQPGVPTAASARKALDALEQAAARLRDGRWQGVVTAPVCKHALRSAGFPFPGQTEFFAEVAGTGDFAMCLAGGSLTVALVTAHLPLREVAGRLETNEIVRIGRLLREFLLRRGVSAPRIAVAGLNPHAGEEGDLGGEEAELIAPAVGILARAGDFRGPFPPDTVFHRAVAGEFDGVLCMYHDQGLIPLKLHAFHEGVNITLGLPFVRTSPDHGTAFDIAGQGVARSDSMVAALDLAARLMPSGAPENRP